MTHFFEKPGATLQAVSLILMLVIPFFLYLTARYGAIIQVILLIALMAGNMLIIMKSGRFNK